MLAGISIYRTIKEAYMTLISNKNHAFTLAETLITLTIIGIVAIITLNILTISRNKCYVESLKKSYTALQTATNAIIAEYGVPQEWWDSSVWSDNKVNEGDRYIVNLYKQHLNVVKDNLSEAQPCYYCTYLFPGVKRPEYKYLNKNLGIVGVFPDTANYIFVNRYTIMLSDGTLIEFYTRKTSYNPDLTFIVDVNGIKGPNQLGRDVFYLSMERTDGKIKPYTDGTRPSPFAQVRYKDTCDKNGEGNAGKGFSCAYKVLIEDNGKMNY